MTIVETFLHIEPGPERGVLGFAKAVRSGFRFLESRGLRVVEEESTFVGYESSSVFVNVYHGPLSYELDVDIGQIDDPARCVTLGEILSLGGASEQEMRQGFCVLTHERVQQFVPILADFFRRYGEPYLSCDPAAYEKVWKSRGEAEEAYTRQVSMIVRRQKSESAWQAKRYAEVVKLYESALDDLSEIEKRRLAYAKKKMGI